MLKTVYASICCSAALAIVSTAGCIGESPPVTVAPSIRFETRSVPPGEAGLPYEAVIAFTSVGGAGLPARFEIAAGALPPGLGLDRDPAGGARIGGVPREPGAYPFTIKAIAKERPDPAGALPRGPDLAVSHAFVLEIGEGTIAILTPTAEEGTSDPAVPAFPAVVPFVNPASAEAFFAFAFLLAGGSNDNVATVYAPREWELSAFDASIADEASLHADTEERPVRGAAAGLSPFEPDFTDGGVFALQAGPRKVQIGGFPSPRGPVMEDRDGDGVQETPFLLSLLPQWFQDPATPRNSRRDLADTLHLSSGDATLGTEKPLLFADYFDPAFKATTAPDARAKYPFSSDQYRNAFFVPYEAGRDATPLAYRLIVEAIDRRGTPLDRRDDIIARKSYIARVEIPDIVIDTVLLPPGQAGVLYAAQVSLSGGVPPLFGDLEWVDGTGDLEPTPGDPLTKDLLGLELDPRAWQFIGAPRAAAPDGTPVELTVRAWAQVMNARQTGQSLVPTGNAGERDGLLDPDGASGPAPAKPGRHRTFPVSFALPTAPSITNRSLRAGIDGQAYPGDRIHGIGGVPLLLPYPPGFFEGASVYPGSSAILTYDWDSEYLQDASYRPRTMEHGLPNRLALVTSATVATNGTITGVTLDRGFHVVRFEGRDFYAGLSSAPDPTSFRVHFEKPLTISVSPDRILYLRGVQAPEAPDGVPTGLADAVAQMAEPQMTPILLAAGLFATETGHSPALFGGLPVRIDTLPVMLTNGGSDAHNRMSIPEVRGFWPAESGQEARWDATGNQAWKHVQQEFTWLQAPDAEQSHVFL